MAGRKNVLPPYSVINAGDVSLATLSGITSVQYIDNIFVTAVWTGTPTGVIAIQFSNDQTNWFTIAPGTALSQPAGSASSTYGVYKNNPAPFMRVLYTSSSGTGALTVMVSGKMV